MTSASWAVLPLRVVVGLVFLIHGGQKIFGFGLVGTAAFMAQAGNLVICGDAGASLGDSLYEAVLYVRGTIHSLGADAREEPMAENDYRTVDELLGKAGINYSSKEFKRVASARTLYHWNAEAGQEY